MVDTIDQPLPPKTTFQEDITVAGQRRINLIWEVTQSVVAITVTFAIIYGSLFKATNEALSNAFFLIIGFYFSRTNHQAIGGIGIKDNEYQEYKGR